jgi:protein SCO1
MYYPFHRRGQDVEGVRRVRVALQAGGLALAAWLLVTSPANASEDGLGGDFNMADCRGGSFRLADHRGKVVTLYFGFTRCPDVCPTELATLAAALNGLGQRAADVLPVFVSVDPERDTASSLTEYVKFFHPSMVALCGSGDDIRSLAARYGATFRKVPSTSALGYTVDHTADLYVIGPDGRLARILPNGTPPEAMVRAIEAALPTGKQTSPR